MMNTDSFRSCRGGLLGKLLFALCLLFVVAAIVWVTLLPRIVSSVIESKTGFVAKIDTLSVDPFTAKVHLAGVVLKNPANWPDASPFVDLREFRVDADVLPLLSGKLKADELVLDVAQVTIVKNKDGVLNAVAFKDGLAGPPEKGAAEKPASSGGKTEFFIKKMVVKFDRLTYVDYSGRAPSTKNYDLAINRELKDVDSVMKIISPFSGAAFGVVSDVVGGALGGAKNLVLDAGGVLKDGGKKAGDSLKGLMQSLEKKKP